MSYFEFLNNISYMTTRFWDTGGEIFLGPLLSTQILDLDRPNFFRH